MGAQKFMGAQKLLRGHDASASLRHPQMAPDTHAMRLHVRETRWRRTKHNSSILAKRQQEVNSENARKGELSYSL